MEMMEPIPTTLEEIEVEIAQIEGRLQRGHTIIRSARKDMQDALSSIRQADVGRLELMKRLCVLTRKRDQLKEA